MDGRTIDRKRTTCYLDDTRGFELVYGTDGVVRVWLATYMVCVCVIQTQFAGQPFGQRCEAAAQNGHFEAQSLQRFTQLSRAGCDGDDGFQLVEYVGWDAFQEGDARF